MENTLKVLLTPSDEGGCGYYRMYFPARALEREFEVEFKDGLPIHRTRERKPRVTGVGDIDADILVLQRPLQRVLADAIPFFQKKGVTVVVDLDDDFACLHPQHLARPMYDPSKSEETNYRHLLRACSQADLVTVSTPALAARYGTRGNSIVLRNCVPESMLEIETDKDDRTVGWSGYTSFHPQDLTATRGGVADAIRETGARMLVVGSGEGVKDDLRLDVEPDLSGPVPLPEYPELIAEFTVGIVPLLESKFNMAKSYLKGLEFATVGVPFVASPLPEYELLHKEGLGLLSKSKASHWKREVKSLLECESKRHELAEYAQAQVRENHTYEGQAWRWAEAWSTVHDRRRIERVVA